MSILLSIAPQSCPLSRLLSVGGRKAQSLAGSGHQGDAVLQSQVHGKLAEVRIINGALAGMPFPRTHLSGFFAPFAAALCELRGPPDLTATAKIAKDSRRTQSEIANANLPASDIPPCRLEAGQVLLEEARQR